MELEHAARPDPILRNIILETYRRGRLYAPIGRLENDPLFYPHMRGSYLMQVGIQQMNWPRILRHFWTAVYTGTKTELVALALLSALLWGIVLHSLYGAPGALAPVARMGIALALGVVSTWPTLWTGFITDDHLGMNAEGDFVHALLYFIASVGLREELCKLLLFAPFLPWILKRGGDLDALILGGMVGLGFAMEENVKYFDALFSGANVVARLVSANVLHFTFTGVCALALTRLVRQPARWMTDSLTLIAMAIGLHGLYNALLTREVPGIGDMSYFAGTAMAIGALYFFQEVGHLAALRGRWLSLTAIFFWGYCALFVLELTMVAFALPFHLALSFIGQSALAGLYYAFVFLHGVREPLAD